MSLRTETPMPESRDTRQAPRIERRGESGACHLIGYAAVFYREGEEDTQYRLWENVYERILPGAFDNLSENDVRGLFNHDRDNILGRVKSGTMSLTVDDIGLRYDITLPDTQAARDLAASVDRGDIDGSSFAFIATSEEWRIERADDQTIEYRNVTGCDVFDVGPVTYPAYKATTSTVAQRSHEHWCESERAARSKTRKRARRLKLARLRDHE